MQSPIPGPVHVITALILSGLPASAPGSESDPPNTLELAEGERLVARREPGWVTVLHAGQALARYRYAGPIRKPYLAELDLPGGPNVLRDAPPDHLHHHGLMFACNVDDVDFWAETERDGRQVHVDFQPLRVESRKGREVAVILEKLLWESAGGEAVLDEERRITVLEPNPDSGPIVLWSSHLTPAGGRPVRLWGRPYHGLGLRFAEAMDTGGTFLEANGGRDVEGTNGQRSAWCTYSAEIAEGQPVTLLLAELSGRRGESCRWFTMTEPFAYLSATDPFGDGEHVLAPGESLVLRHALALLRGAADAETGERTYDGLAATLVDGDVDAARRDDFVVLLRDAEGEPLGNVPVIVEQTEHDFLFGCNIYAFGRFHDPFREQAYKRAFRRVFNYATLPFYWKSHEPQRGQPLEDRIGRILDWCEANGVVTKGHPLVWTHPAGVPDWLKPLSPAATRKTVEARVEGTVARFRARMDFWDVVNEPTHTPPFAGFEDRVEQVVATYRAARQADPSARLVLNEYHVMSEVTDLAPFARSCLEAGAPIDALGIQAHEPRCGYFEAARIRRVLNHHAVLGKEIHLTEVTFPSGGQRVKRRQPDGSWAETSGTCSEAWQARALEVLYRAAFGHPSVTAITWWDLADGHSWLPGGGLLREDLSPKPAYQLLDRLVNDQWRTELRTRTDPEGRLRFRGFFGAYSVRVGEGDEPSEATFELRRTGARHVEARPRAAWRLEPESPGGVFDPGSPVVVSIHGPDPLGRVRVQDRHGEAGPTASVRHLSGIEHRIRLESLPPGYWTLEVTETAAMRSATLPIVVLPPGLDPEASLENGVAVDAALAWLAPARAELILDLARRAGVRWIRERLSWGSVEPRPGTYRWEHYDGIATAARERGIAVYQVFHDTPRWAVDGPGGKRFPDDLRVIHRFAREAGTHFLGRVRAWEPWNEPDISIFSGEPADQCAAFLKAASLGFRAADASIVVLMPSLAQAPGLFVERFLENETGPYFDVYNFHTYSNVADYPALVDAHRALRRRFGIQDRPAWVTEAGIRLLAPGGHLEHDQALTQAAFLARSVATSLGLGTDRHFFFVLPYYHENDVQFGILRRDGSPGPAYAALAALNAVLARAERPRRLAAAPPGTVAWLFSRGDGRDAAILWKTSEGEVDLLPPRGTELVDLLGAPRRSIDAPVPLGDEPVYLLGPGEAFAVWRPVAAREVSGATGTTRLAPPALAGLVLRFRFPFTAADKRNEAWRTDDDGYLAGRVEIVNLSEATVSGELRLNAATGVELEPASSAVRLGPGERGEVEFESNIRDGDQGPFRIHAAMHVGEERSSAAVAWIE